MTTTSTAKRPTHRIYVVTPGKDEKSKGQWDEIGAAWAHKDGKGFSLKLKLVPRDPHAELVIREAKAKGGK